MKKSDPITVLSAMNNQTPTTPRSSNLKVEWLEWTKKWPSSSLNNV